MNNMKDATEKGRTEIENLQAELRLVFYEDAGIWFSHCLEMDVIGHGSTQKEAFQQMIGAIVLQIKQSLKHNNRANIFMPADAKYFEMYAAGKHVGRAKLKIEKYPALKRRNICSAVSRATNGVVQHLEAREYALV